MIPTTSQHGEGTWVLRVGLWRYLIFLGRVKPHSLPDHQVLSPHMAAVVMDLWFRDRCIDRYRQAALYFEFNPVSTDLSGVGERQLEAWLVDAVAAGRLRIYKFSRTVGGTPSAKLAAQQEERAKSLGADVPKRAEPVLHPEQGLPYAVYKGSGGGALPDENDAQAEQPTCPNAYHRSETLESAKPEVREWLDHFETRGEMYQRNLLGGNPDAGGGFLQGTTEVVTIPAGTTLWRYIDKPEKPWGGWWFFSSYEGDPRAFAALPPASSGKVLVQGQTKKAFEALCGPGAPRCTNKPGGPPQLCIPHSPPFPNNSETALISLVTT